MDNDTPYDAAQAAKKLKVAKNTVYEAIRAGDIPSIKIAGRILIPRPAFDRLLRDGNLRATLQRD